MGTTPLYATREDFQRAVGYADTALDAAAIDRALRFGTQQVENRLHRKFYPALATRYKAFPDGGSPTPWRLWLDEDEILEVTSATAAGVALDLGDLFFEPSEPPYNSIEIDRSSSTSFTIGVTPQRNIALTGWFGACRDTESAGTVAVGVNASVTTMTVSNGATVGIGDAVKVDDEYMVIQGRGWVDTTQDLVGNVDAKVNDRTVDVADGSAFHVDEYILIDSEWMLVTDIAGNNLFVRRSVNGSTLTAHSAGASVYASRNLTVARGCLGTTAAAHDLGDTVLRHVVPAPVQSLALAEALSLRLQEGAGYVRTIGSGEAVRNASGAGLEDIREQVYRLHGRTSRSGVI